MRIKTRWVNKDRDHPPAETGTVLAFNIWKIAGAIVLHLENENYQIDTHFQRLDVIEELVCLFVHIADRMTISWFDADQRQEMMNSLGGRTAGLIQENRESAIGPGKYSNAFLQLLNERLASYAEMSVEDDNTPGFSMSRDLGNHVAAAMGDRDNKWIPNQIMDIEIPSAMKNLLRVISGIAKNEPLDKRDDGMPRGPTYEG